jgi:hypothetical protein
MLLLGFSPSEEEAAEEEDEAAAERVNASSFLSSPPTMIGRR